MTKKLFWTDPYLIEIDSRIASINGRKITLEETIFFAFSGGQESDTGTIGGYQVMEAKKIGREIEYCLPENHKLKKDQKVTIKVAWERRYNLMRLHFAAELILKIMYQKLQGSEKIGAHIAEEKARIDFNWPVSISPLLPEIAAEAEAIIEKNIKISSNFSDEQNEKRYWEVEGFGKAACGGTHLKETGEVGKIRLKRKNIGKGKERVEIYLQSDSK